MTAGPLIFRQLFDSESFTYTYLLADYDSREGIIIDPVKEQSKRDFKLIQELEIKLKYILDTHVHADHITAASDLRALTKAQTIIGKEAGVHCADRLVGEGERIVFGQFDVLVIATPGHTDASYSFLVRDKLFTGDALFIRGCGRTDFQSGSPEVLYESITKKIFGLPDETLIYPGHDYNGMTVSTVREEKKFNPRLGGGRTKAEFVKLMSELKLADPKKIHEAVPANLQCGNLEG